jgi:hypothetical protein
MIMVECASTSVHRLPIKPKLEKIENSGITSRVAGSIFAVSTKRPMVAPPLIE